MGRSSILIRIPTCLNVGLRRSICAGVLALLAGAPAALADSTQSTNWAGYAVHGGGVSYRSVEGTWTEPSASCVRGASTYSSYWVGIGGYSATSQALEQIGTEVDCSAGGGMSSTAWYEMVPAPSTPVRLGVRPGDVMQASVTISASTATLVLNN